MTFNINIIFRRVSCIQIDHKYIYLMSYFIHFLKAKTNTKLKVTQLEYILQKSGTDYTSKLCDYKNSKFFILHSSIRAHLHNA